MKDSIIIIVGEAIHMDVQRAIEAENEKRTVQWGQVIEPPIKKGEIFEIQYPGPELIDMPKIVRDQNEFNKHRAKSMHLRRKKGRP